MTFSSQKIGFGIIGGGAIGPFHAEAITNLPNTQIIGVCDKVEARAKDLAEKYNINMWCTDYHKLLENKDIDVVNLCLPPFLNEEITLAAAEAGKHIIVEKPMAINITQADNMIAACRKAKVKLGVIFPCRFSKDIQLIKNTIDEGKLGKLFMGSAYTKWFRTKEYYEIGAWRKTWAEQGGGALINQAIHAIDLLQWFMGPVDSLYGFMDTVAHKIEVEDVVVAALRFKNGAMGVIEGSTAVYPGFPRRLEICGKKGSIVLKVDDIELWAIMGSKIKIRGSLKEDYIDKRVGDASSGPVYLSPEHHGLQIKDFIEAIREYREPLVNGEEGRKAIEIIKAIYKSAKSGKEVKFPLKE